MLAMCEAQDSILAKLKRDYKKRKVENKYGIGDSDKKEKTKSYAYDRGELAVDVSDALGSLHYAKPK